MKLWLHYFITKFLFIVFETASCTICNLEKKNDNLSPPDLVNIFQQINFRQTVRHAKRIKPTQFRGQHH